MKTLIVVDCQNDFITGTLSCIGAKDAIKNIVNFINSNEVGEVCYSTDYHNKTNKSFEINGGIWPVHCIAGEFGSEISNDFDEVQNKSFKPLSENLYRKGIDDEVEEYSAYYAKNENGKTIADIVSDEFIVCGLASEYCVRETVLEFLNNGKNVKLFLNGVGYVNEDDHIKNIAELRKLGVEIV
ncbi:isochorismatase family protein [Peptoniphilus sp. oral taxon 386]|uniref:isochorismatase family protein n=1 Tax=Peptoniphilus sp. oral taxon 386 TaxID=652713 RepID=UPI0001DA9FCB|nr:isochorismatase family protein [Peptoniphilus sp. oral taxon 386]EFI41583.1 hypothetical protein HMPREF0629_00205 [Peptoniphilus sp. oral taxon 386 str. F0131]